MFKLLARSCVPISVILTLTACGEPLAPLAETGPRIDAQVERQWPNGGPGRQSVFSRDGSLLATSDAGGPVTVHRVGEDAPVRTLSHDGGATALAFNGDGTQLFSAGYDGAIRQWDLASGRLLATHTGATGTIWSLHLSPDGRRLASGGEDKVVRLWPVAGGAARALAGHELNVWEVRFSPDGRELASASYDGTVRIWDVAAGAERRQLVGHEQAVVGLDYSPDGRLIATGSDDSTVRVWRASDGALLHTLRNGTHAHKVAFSGDGRWLASAGRARGAVGGFWHGLTGAGGEAAPVRVWRVADGALVAALPHREDVMYVAFSPDSQWLVTAGDTPQTRLWRIRPTEQR